MLYKERKFFSVASSAHEVFVIIHIDTAVSLSVCGVNEKIPLILH